MIKEILHYRDQGLSFREIAKELNSTVGKVHYSWTKHLKEQQQQELNTKAENLFHFPSIPSSYSIDRICTMVQNPTTLYIYWDLSESKIHFIEQYFQKKFSTIPKVIKIYHITSILFNGHNAHNEIEIALPEMTNNWFVRDLEPNQTYIAEFGVKTEQGSIFTMMRSNPIDTPRNHQNQVGHFSESVQKWKQSQSTKPDWLENFSTYSYYEGLFR